MTEGVSRSETGRCEDWAAWDRVGRGVGEEEQTEQVNRAVQEMGEGWAWGTDEGAEPLHCTSNPVLSNTSFSQQAQPTGPVLHHRREGIAAYATMFLCAICTVFYTIICYNKIKIYFLSLHSHFRKIRFFTLFCVCNTLGFLEERQQTDIGVYKLLSQNSVKDCEWYCGTLGSHLHLESMPATFSPHRKCLLFPCSSSLELQRSPYKEGSKIIMMIHMHVPRNR